MRRLIIALLLVFSYPVVALDSTIRVLAAFPSHLTEDPVHTASQLAGIVAAWENTSLAANSTGGITIEIINFGIAEAVALPGMPGTILGIAQWAYVQPDMIAKRNMWSADVVVLFVPLASVAGTDCGRAPLGWSNDNFSAGAIGADATYAFANGLDLYSQNLKYVAVVGSPCQDNAASHEFGHVLGGQHNYFGTYAPGLYPDSRAFQDVRYFSWPEYGINVSWEESTALGTPPNPSEGILGCPELTAWCAFTQIYSHPGYWGDDNHDNARALAETAQSVANYRHDSSPPGSVLNPPINVSGFVIDPCWSGWTGHFVAWDDNPQTNVPVVAYNLWGEAPPGTPIQYGWSIPAPQKYSGLWNNPFDVRVKMAACSATQCSALSSSSYYAPYLCQGGGQ
jgi:hypothetical protein